MNDRYILSTCRFCRLSTKHTIEFAGRAVRCDNCGSPVVIGMIKQFVTYDEVHKDSEPFLSHCMVQVMNIAGMVSPSAVCCSRHSCNPQ